MDGFLPMLALVGAVIVVSALLSGWVDRTGVPPVAVFLALGALIGPYGLGLIDATAQSPTLRVVATLSLVLVLFTDAVSLDLKEVRKHRLLASLVLGPGTLLSAALIAGAAMWLLKLSLPLAAILGAAIASTDPVLLRGLLRRPALNRRQPDGTDVQRSRRRCPRLRSRASGAPNRRRQSLEAFEDFHAGGVLCLSARSDERPCGARVTAHRMAQHTRARRRREGAKSRWPTCEREVLVLHS